MKLAALLLATAPLFASPCKLPLPGEGYVSTACSILESETIEGEWFVDPLDVVLIDFNICTANEHYVSNGVVIANLYDGAPRGNCGDKPIVPVDPPFIPYVPHSDPVATPEPPALISMAFGLLLLVGIRRAHAREL